jgi:hypothetical protein
MFTDVCPNVLTLSLWCTSNITNLIAPNILSYHVPFHVSHTPVCDFDPALANNFTEGQELMIHISSSRQLPGHHVHSPIVRISAKASNYSGFNGRTLLQLFIPNYSSHDAIPGCVWTRPLDCSTLSAQANEAGISRGTSLLSSD